PYAPRGGGGVRAAWPAARVDAAAAAELAADGWTVGVAPTLMTDVPATALIAATALALVRR
ncbi:MAG: 2-phospho-L-lactate transferase, partial [Cellulomonas sp.]|nr:2-phospho-L-lactate transferase [Cellulomonas sp.]